MSNDEIVNVLELTGKLMELHNEDPFKIRSYAGAAFNLDKLNQLALGELSIEDLGKIQGIGKSLASKIHQISTTGTLTELDELLKKTPEGVLKMFSIKGIGAKKIAIIWHDLGIETIDDLEKAGKDGKLASLKGFGEGTQKKILESITFLDSQKGKLRMNTGESVAKELNDKLSKEFPDIILTGEIVRKSEIIHSIQFLIPSDRPWEILAKLAINNFLSPDQANSSPFTWRGFVENPRVNVEIFIVKPEKLLAETFVYSAAEEHLAKRVTNGRSLYELARSEEYKADTELYEKAGLPFIIPEMREGELEWSWSEDGDLGKLIQWKNLRGILHNHSTYSDGKHSLEQMARKCRALGFEYLGIADHSQNAAYANGMRADRVQKQHAEIDLLNEKFKEEDSDKPFKIFKGIEADILGDGALDYDEELLASFDFIVASIHSNLAMTLEKAMERLLRAIANPYTTILGHMTGRLLLMRDGYPVDHAEIIDACAEHNVIIELNADPHRLDIDWRWIPYCMEKNVRISINPDAHEMEGYKNMEYGVSVARKGGLTVDYTFNSLSLGEMEKWLAARKKSVTIS